MIICVDVYSQSILMREFTDLSDALAFINEVFSPQIININIYHYENKNPRIRTSFSPSAV